MFEIKNLSVKIGDKTIVSNFSLSIHQRELHVLMGPNGSGKSSLVNALSGHPHYEIYAGTFMLSGKDMRKLLPEERSREGLFVAFQKPVPLPGVPVAAFLQTVARAHMIHSSPLAIRNDMMSGFERVGLSVDTREREVHVAFSGGESKRLEVAQLAIIPASIAILDEPDSGLDLDGFRMIAKEIERLRENGLGLLIITHNPKMIAALKPNTLHIMVKGRLVASGEEELGEELNTAGFDRWEHASYDA